ncbi:MAG: prepilin peptidase, partial [Actinobacteria bacterium]|nr:prepilin peptidase [Actinomycetota bacterium]
MAFMTTQWLVTAVLLFGLLLFSVRSDLRERKIFNKVTVSFAVVGLFLNTVYDVPGGFLTGLTGLAVGLFVFMIPYLMHGMGAGDLKLMAAVGALTNWRFVLYVAL